MASRPTYLSQFASLRLSPVSSTSTVQPRYIQIRQFSASCSLQKRKMTKQRRQMFAWLDGPGASFKRPLGASTNYLGAYDKEGRRKDEKFNTTKVPSRGEEDAKEKGREADQKQEQAFWDAPKEELKAWQDSMGLSDESLSHYRKKYPGIEPYLIEAVEKGEMKEEELPGLVERIVAERPKKNSNAPKDKEFDPDEEERKEAENDIRKLREKEAGSKPRRSELKSNLKPFPLNPHFYSEPVLSEELREIIYLKVVEDQMTLRSVSVQYGVSMERVGAVVRMKQMERDWLRQGKSLAVPYSRAVLDMLPQTPYVDPAAPPPTDKRTGRPRPRPIHEPINDLPVHPATTQQIFHPVSESRAFTRADAGKAFHPKLLPADDRIPHPELIAIEKLKLKGASTPQLEAFKKELVEKEREEQLKRAKEEQEREAREVKVYPGQRYDFKFQDVSVDSVGKHGRSRAGVGWRYGMPHEDRKPGQVKIPTSV